MRIIVSPLFLFPRSGWGEAVVVVFAVAIPTPIFSNCNCYSIAIAIVIAIAIYKIFSNCYFYCCVVDQMAEAPPCTSLAEILPVIALWILVVSICMVFDKGGERLH